jgi:K319L-like, PKD domain
MNSIQKLTELKAGSDLQIRLPDNSVNLDGNLSVDPDSIIVSYLWEETAAPAEPIIESPNSAITKVSGLKEGVYQLKLTVTDNKGVKSSSLIHITVLPAEIPPKP